jgi:hypothetical protein
MQRRILLVTVVLLFAIAAGGFQQTQPNDTAQQPPTDKHMAMLGLVRMINTFEVGEISQHGSYSTWPVLLKNDSDEFNGWLARNWTDLAGIQGAAPHFSALPEVLPGVKLRLEPSTDGRSFSVLLEDANDKQGFAFYSDERGIIREGKFIR